MAVSLWSGWRSLLQFWILTRTPPGDPVVALCPGDPAALDHQDWPLHTFQPFIDDTDFGVGQLRALSVGLGGSRAGHPSASPLCAPPG